MNTIAAKIPPAAATPSPTYIHASDVMPRNLAGSDGPRNPPKGPIVMKFLCSLLLVTACSGATKSKIEVAKTGVVECVKADAAAIVALTGELAANAIGSVLHVGAIDWDGLVARAKSAGVQVGGCAFAALYKALDDAEPATQMRSVAATPDARKQALERLRAELGGARWEIAGGRVL
jgi:hypothetical protein